jgi:hypothetical protein
MGEVFKEAEAPGVIFGYIKGLDLSPFNRLIESFHFLLKSRRGIDPELLVFFVQPQGWETLGILGYHPFEEGAFGQLWPERDLGEIPEDKGKYFFLLLMGKRTNPGGNERIFKFHGIFINFFFIKINGIL